MVHSLSIEHKSDCQSIKFWADDNYDEIVQEFSTVRQNKILFIHNLQ